MPLYDRPDSPNWYVSIGATARVSSGVPIKGATPEETAANRKRAEDFEARLSERYWRAKNLGDYSGIPFHVAAADYLAEQPEGTHHAERVLIDTWISANIPAHESIGEVAKKSRLKQLRDQRYNGGAVAKSTVNRTLATVRAILRHMWKQNEDDVVYLAQQPQVPLFKLEKVEASAYTPEQYVRLWPHLVPHLRWWSAAAILTMLRMGVLMRMRWDWFVTVTNTAGERETFIKVPSRYQKNDEPHMIPVTPLLANVFQEIRAIARAQWDQYLNRCKRLRWMNPPPTVRTDWDWEHVFTWRGRRVGNCNRGAFARALAATGLADQGYTWHSFRHMGASLAAMAGCEDTVIQLMGRWLNPDMVARYTHYRTQRTAAGFQGLATMLGSSVPVLAGPAQPGGVLDGAAAPIIVSHERSRVPGTADRCQGWDSTQFPHRDEMTGAPDACNPLIGLMPTVGLEPTTYALRRGSAAVPTIKNTIKIKELTKTRASRKPRQGITKDRTGT